MKGPRESNSYDFIRFCAATAVLVSHHFALSGMAEPQVPGYREDYGNLGVEVFFCLSGFLICRSLIKSADWADFLAARFLRIFPNLAFSLTATSVATLIWYHNYSHLWKHIKFTISNLLMFFRGVTYTIPGVFQDAKGSPTINGSLWSLPFELWLYIFLFLFYVAGRRRNGIIVLISPLVASIVWAAISAFDNKVLSPFDSYPIWRLGAFFFSGSWLAFVWPYIERHAVIIGAGALAALMLIRSLIPIETVFHPLALATVVIGLGSSKSMAWFSRGGDASYGMYIFAWPIQQFALILIDSFWLSMLCAFVATTALGYATWHTFEKQAMSLRKSTGNHLRAAARDVGGRLKLRLMASGSGP